MSNTIMEYKDEVTRAVKAFKHEVETVTKKYDEEMFIADGSININEVPLTSFKYLSDGGLVSIETYDADAGTNNLRYKVSFGGSFDIVFHSVEIPTNEPKS